MHFFTPIRSVIALVIEQIGLPQRGRPILLNTCVITEQIGPHKLTPLSPITIIYITWVQVLNCTGDRPHKLNINMFHLL